MSGFSRAAFKVVLLVWKKMQSFELNNILWKQFEIA